MIKRACSMLFSYQRMCAKASNVLDEYTHVNGYAPRNRGRWFSGVNGGELISRLDVRTGVGRKRPPTMMPMPMRENTCVLRNRINPSGMKGVTTENSFDRQKGAFQGAVACDGFEGIVRTAGVKPAIRTQERGDKQFINPYKSPQHHGNDIALGVIPVQGASAVGRKGIAMLKKCHSTEAMPPFPWQ
jgi:hypothetical protein